MGGERVPARARSCTTPRSINADDVFTGQGEGEAFVASSVPAGESESVAMPASSAAEGGGDGDFERGTDSTTIEEEGIDDGADDDADDALGETE